MSSDRIEQTPKAPDQNHATEAAVRLLNCSTEKVVVPELPSAYIQNIVWEKDKSEDEWLAMKVRDLKVGTISYWAQPGDNEQYQIMKPGRSPNAVEQVFRAGHIDRQEPPAEIEKGTPKYQEIEDLIHNQVDWTQCPPPKD